MIINKKFLINCVQIKQIQKIFVCNYSKDFKIQRLSNSNRSSKKENLIEIKSEFDDNDLEYLALEEDEYEIEPMPDDVKKEFIESKKLKRNKEKEKENFENVKKKNSDIKSDMKLELNNEYFGYKKLVRQNRFK